MKKLNSSEIYSKTYGADNEIKIAISNQLRDDIGVISPEHIQNALLTLKTCKAGSYYPFLSDALALYETRGLIRLFNLSNANGGRSKIPTTLPYFVAAGRNRSKETGFDKVIFVNMYRIGHWGPDDTTYEGLNQVALTDLYTCLESGVIGYKLVVQNMADKLFENKNVLEHLIKIYTIMFAQAVQKTKTSFGSEDFQNDVAYFLIARFLLLNVLEKSDSEFVDDLAYLAVQHRSSLESLKSFEEISMISYDTLSEFLKTFGAAFYNGEPISLIDFENKWVSLYGDGTGLAIEFIPYLLHFLFAALHGAMLGGSNRIYRQDNIKKLIPRLYMAIINILK